MKTEHFFPNKYHHYPRRDKHLMEMGFDSYRSYLQSDLWRSIRSRVLASKGGKCVLCDDPASEIHHNGYRKEHLDGRQLNFLFPLCRKCHQFIEYDGKRKRTFPQTRKAFKRLLKQKTGMTIVQVTQECR
jgi:5-methylcytosine-specific restriction endonuclease McrA